MLSGEELALISICDNVYSERADFLETLQKKNTARIILSVLKS
jgi:hypothetical protein